MALIDIKEQPSASDLRWFALFWIIFMLILGKLAFASDRILLVLALINGIFVLVSWRFNRDYPRAQQRIAVLLPLVLLGISGLEFALRLAPAMQSSAALALGPWLVRGDHAQWSVLVLLASFGVLSGGAALARPNVAARLYRGWMFATLPIGWCLSHLLLAAIFFLVITPIGLLRRMRSDPLQIRWKVGTRSLWHAHQAAEKSRYFKMF